MEKKAVVQVGHTPSVVSGKPSEIVKSGHAFRNGEADTIIQNEKSLAKQMQALYNGGNDAAESN